jgi:hypothetical protein
MDTRTSDPFKLIPMTNAVASEFDVAHKNKKEYTTSAVNHAKEFIL